MKSGIHWGEIYSVSGCRLDLMTRTVLVVTFDVDSGEFSEVMDDWPGFTEVAAAITVHLPGIVPSWLDSVQAVAVRDAAVVVWKRG